MKYSSLQKTFDRGKNEATLATRITIQNTAQSLFERGYYSTIILWTLIFVSQATI